MYFKSLSIKQWQQFESVEIKFHDRLTVLTGANGSGKTTLLNLLSRHSGWNTHSYSTPKEEKSTGIIKFFSRLFNGEDKSRAAIFGNIQYSNSKTANLAVQNSNSAQYLVQIQQQQPVKCFYIPSHRSVFRYQPVANIPTQKKKRQNAFKEISSLNIQRYTGQNTQSSSFVIKSTLIGWAINGYGVKNNNNKVVMPADQELISFYEGFQRTLRKVLPESLGFKELEIRNMEVVFICNDGADEFILETASGGISALIDIAWHIYMFSTKENSDFTVIIDEVENHLHPIMQRTILQKLLAAFPSARFIVTTHSPLVVGSVKDSSVYALSYNVNNKIMSQYLDLLGEARTASEILDEVLGVSFTMPLWVENQLDVIISKYSKNPITKESLENLRKELTEGGLEKLLPYAIKEIAEASND